ncbi:MAG: hypothetical protein ACR2KV_00045 [Solirubrobacteraceae bacterium]
MGRVHGPGAVARLEPPDRVGEVDLLNYSRPTTPQGGGNGRALGVYGLQIDGLTQAACWMQPLRGAAGLAVELSTAAGHARSSRVDADNADIELRGGGRLVMHRGSGRAEFAFTDRPTAADLLHPYLAPAAALAQIWVGAEALHAGALAAPAGAVLLLGGKEAGKSTTLAWLAVERRVAVLADDLAVLVAGAVLAGPRCLDIRPSDAFPGYGLGGDVRRGDRLRLPLAPVASAVPVAGVAVLRWAARIQIGRVPVRDRLGELLGQRMFRAHLAADLPAILDLAARPMITVARPRGAEGLAAAGDALLRYFA